jgi:hypothetical protein
LTIDRLENVTIAQIGIQNISLSAVPTFNTRVHGAGNTTYQLTISGGTVGAQVRYQYNNSVAVGVLANETQTIRNLNPTGVGTWTLTFNGAETAVLQTTATAADVQLALENLLTIGVGNVVIRRRRRWQVLITFTSAPGNANVNPLISTNVASGPPTLAAGADSTSRDGGLRTSLTFGRTSRRPQRCSNALSIRC